MCVYYMLCIYINNSIYMCVYYNINMCVNGLMDMEIYSFCDSFAVLNGYYHEHKYHEAQMG